ncbi:MAG: extracellular solute-binding protein [Verrucomicrobiota bacterium]|jgi:ABC-type molybdate transport system substrate-binding protein|nr:extracellular solute-binding protein [Verrucomicrobiota bacterium]
MKTFHILLSTVLIVLASHCTASAQRLILYADTALRPALKELLPVFTEQTGFAVQPTFQSSDALAERIMAGKSADIFFPLTEEALDKLMEKGLVDVALKRNVLVIRHEGDVVYDTQYPTAAVMANTENRVSAMAFLDFLTSETARRVFTEKGFELP